jgi:hypothetical protein
MPRRPWRYHVYPVIVRQNLCRQSPLALWGTGALSSTIQPPLILPSSADSARL